MEYTVCILLSILLKGVLKDNVINIIHPPPKKLSKEGAQKCENEVHYQEAIKFLTNETFPALKLKLRFYYANLKSD